MAASCSVGEIVFNSKITFKKNNNNLYKMVQYVLMKRNMHQEIILFVNCSNIMNVVLNVVSVVVYVIKKEIVLQISD